MVSRPDRSGSKRCSRGVPRRLPFGGKFGTARRGVSAKRRNSRQAECARYGIHTMTAATEFDLKSFVLLRLGELRYAVAADATIELLPLSRIFRFPHKTPEIEGVILRRGRIIPVCDVAEALVGKRTV